LRNNSNSGILRLYKNPKSTENTLKNPKTQQSTETKRIVNTDIGYKLGRGPVFTEKASLLLTIFFALHKQDSANGSFKQQFTLNLHSAPVVHVALIDAN